MTSQTVSYASHKSRKQILSRSPNHGFVFRIHSYVYAKIYVNIGQSVLEVFLNAFAKDLRWNYE